MHHVELEDLALGKERRMQIERMNNRVGKWTPFLDGGGGDQRKERKRRRKVNK